MKRLFDRETWREVFATIRSNRRRTIVTAMGIFWGLFLLVILLSVGYGFNNAINRAIGAIAHNTLITIGTSTTMPYKGFSKGRVWYYDLDDEKTLRKNVPEIEYITCINFSYGNEPISSEGKSVYSSNMVGVTPDYFQILLHKVIEGRLLNEIDEREARNNCLLGSELKEKLFGSESALGKQIVWAGSSYTVVGVIKQVSEEVKLFGSSSQMVLFPNQALRRKYAMGDKVDGFVFSVKDDILNTQAVLDRVNSLLRSRHDVAPDDEQAMFSIDLSQFSQMMDMILMAIYLLVWLVGIGTIISGIVGISNIMLVTVRERTREIGVRRAIGAKPKDIVIQILLESVTITTLAGLAGFIPGALIMIGVNSIVQQNPSSFIYQPIIPFEIALLAALIVLLSGLLGGLLPTTRAIKIKAIDALRDE